MISKSNDPAAAAAAEKFGQQLSAILVSTDEVLVASQVAVRLSELVAVNRRQTEAGVTYYELHLRGDDRDDEAITLFQEDGEALLQRLATRFPAPQ